MTLDTNTSAVNINFPNVTEVHIHITAVQGESLEAQVNAKIGLQAEIERLEELAKPNPGTGT